MPGLEGTVDGAHEIAELRIADRDLFIWDDGGPVATVTKTRHSTHGIVVSLVYTPPAHRNRGCTFFCCGCAESATVGCRLGVLFALHRLANPTSNSIYQRIGYRPVADFDEYIFGG